MLEHLSTTPTGLSFTSGILLLMAHSPEVLTYQGEGIEGSSFQFIRNSTAAVVLNQKLHQLLTVPEPTAVPPNLDASIPTETSTPLTGSQAHQSCPAKRLCTRLDSLSEPDTERHVEATSELGDDESVHSSGSDGSYNSSERDITSTKKLADTCGDESDSTSLESEKDAPVTGEEIDNAGGGATHSTDPEGSSSSDEEQTVPSSRSILAPPTLTILEGEDSKEE